MIRTPIAFGVVLAFSATALAAPMSHPRLQTRAASLHRAHLKPFTKAEQSIFERASVFTGVGGDGGGGSGGGSSN